MNRPAATSGRIDAAIRSRRNHTDQLIADVDRAIRQLRKSGTAVTVRGVANRAGVSRTFLYENDAARQLVQNAVSAANGRGKVSKHTESSGAQVDSGWRERALNA